MIMWTRVQSTHDKELIDTLWNVNASPFTSSLTGFIELIDTLWNVNEEGKFDFAIVSNELIDTLWNVNTLRSQSHGNEPKN